MFPNFFPCLGVVPDSSHMIGPQQVLQVLLFHGRCDGKKQLANLFLPFLFTWVFPCEVYFPNITALLHSEEDTLLEQIHENIQYILEQNAAEDVLEQALLRTFGTMGFPLSVLLGPGGDPSFGRIRVRPAYRLRRSRLFV